MAMFFSQNCMKLVNYARIKRGLLGSSYPVRNLTVKSSNNGLQIDWENGNVGSYPYIFLRDNCQCDKCFHATAKQRQFDTALKVPLDIKPESIEQANDAVNLKWEDGHQSTFEYKWLQERQFPKTDADVTTRSNCGLTPKTWGGELNGNIPTYNFEAIISKDVEFLSWLETLAVRGIALIENAPSSSDIFASFCQKLFCPIRTTHYGEVFTVINKPEANNLAYTAGYLPLHVDLPFYRYQPGVQILHCVKQAKGVGGENHFVDGFKIAEQLRAEAPEAFQVLSSVKFTFEDVGEDQYGEFRKVYERSVIGLDPFGNVQSIAQNNHVRSSFINAPAEKIKQIYEAYYKLVKTMYDEANLLTYKQKGGDIVTFNNQRILHGRAAYRATTTRHLTGCYFDWDEFYSAIRIYRRRLGLE